MVDERTTHLLADLAAELQATEELPVERSASRWIGEAQAVATDLTQGDPDTETIQRRVSHVVDLLDNVDDTGHPAADEHVSTATALAADVLASLD